MDKINVSEKCGAIFYSFFLFLTFIIFFQITISSARSEHAYRTVSLPSATLKIPQEYLNFSYTSVGKESVLIQGFYPGNVPLPDSYEVLEEQGNWYQQMTLLFTDLKKYKTGFNLRNSFIAFKKLYKADKAEKTNFGLTKYTQSSEKDSYKEDIWVEEDTDQIVTLITCMDEKNSSKNYICNLKYMDDRFEYSVMMDKRFLSEWKKIKENTHNLVNSFLVK